MDKSVDAAKMQTAKTITAKAELALEDERRISVPRLDSIGLDTADDKGDSKPIKVDEDPGFDRTNSAHVIS